MSDERRAEDVCSFFANRAYEALDGWDGQDNGDLIRLLAEKLGLSLFEVKNLVEKLMEEDRAAYAVACDTPKHGLAAQPAPASDISPGAGT